MAKRPVAKTKSKPRKTASKAKPPVRRPSKAAKPSRKAERTVTVILPRSITVSLPPVLHDRLKGLSQIMGLSTEGVVRQALTEFADAWEEHHRTIAALADTGDRVQLSVKD